MDAQPLPTLAVPPDYRSHWSTMLDIPESSIDVYGHMGASTYPGFIDRALEAFYEHLFGVPVPDYVAGQFCMRFRRELVLDRGPVRAHARLDAVTGSRLEITVVLEDTEGVPCTVAHYRGVAWDRERRRSRPMTAAEHTALEAHLIAGRTKEKP